MANLVAVRLWNHPSRDRFAITLSSYLRRAVLTDRPYNVTMRVTVFGLWHLGCVTAACLAAAGNQVTGLDLDETVIGNLKVGHPPLQEPGLSELITSEISED